MIQILVRNISNFGFGLGLLIILLVGAFAITDLRALIESNNRVGHTLMILAKLDETLALITDAETAQRGYIIAGDERFLEPYNASISAEDGIGQHLQELRELTTDNSDRQELLDLLDSLVAEKLAFIQETIDLRRTEGFDAAQAVVLTGEGQQTMDDIRRVIAEMQNQESVSLQNWSDLASASLQSTLASLTVGAGMSLLLLLLSFYVVNREVRERRHAEQILRQLNMELDQRVEQRTAELAAANERYIQTLDNILEGCQIIGHDWRYLYVNEVAARQVRKTREELLGHTMMEMYPGIENTELFAKLERCMQERIASHWDNEFTFPDGSTSWFELSLQPVPEGVLILSIDISKRKKAEEAIKEKERLLSEAQRIGHIGSWSYDIDTDRLTYTDEMYRLFDISPQEFEHNSEGFLRLIYSSDRPMVAKWMEDIRAGKQVSDLEFRIFRKNSEVRYIQCTGAVKFYTHGKPVRFIGTARDVTERKLAELQIRRQIEHLTALSKIDKAIMSSFNLDVTLDILLSQVISQLQVDAADILLLDPVGQSLEYTVGRGFRTRALETTSVRMADSQAARERRLIYIQNLEYKPDARLISPLGASEEFVCYFGVPLIVKTKVKGLLEIFHRSPLYPYDEWLDFLNTLAGQAAIAIENATLFESLERSNQELSQAYDATIEGWSRALDLRDKETEGHTQRVTEMTISLARRFDFPEEELLHIRWGALLHDIGKMGVPDNILLKPAALTPEEWETMRQHPVFAYKMLAPITYLRRALDIPYYHHEKWDGTGYPQGLKGEEIPLAARLFAAVDVWDALRSDRPYRLAWPREKTLEHIESLSGAHFDSKVVEYFMELIN